MKNYKHNKRRKGYSKIKHDKRKKRRRAHDFISHKDANDMIIVEGIKDEYNTTKIRLILLFVSFIIAVLLILADIRDKGLLFSGFGFEYSGTLVGVLLAIIIIVFIYKTKGKVEIKG